MLRLSGTRVPRTAWSMALCVAAACAGLFVPCRSATAIEMFTYFGDGSRIGLPSLEVPIEAYPGIPLRSDRIRARRRATQTGQPVRVGPPGGITIRSMPQAEPVPMRGPR